MQSEAEGSAASGGYPYVRASGPACRTAADWCYGKRIVPSSVLGAAVIRTDADLVEHLYATARAGRPIPCSAQKCGLATTVT